MAIKSPMISCNVVDVVGTRFIGPASLYSGKTIAISELVEIKLCWFPVIDTMGILIFFA